MGEVMVVLKVFPEEPGTEEKIIEKIKKIKKGKVKEVKKEPLAFGMFAVIAGIVLSGKKEGEMNALEEEISSIPGVKEVSVEGTTLL